MKRKSTNQDIDGLNSYITRIASKSNNMRKEAIINSEYKDAMTILNQADDVNNIAGFYNILFDRLKILSMPNTIEFSKALIFNIIKSSLDKGMDINASNKIGDTLLSIFIKINNNEVVEYLIKNGANTNTKDFQGNPVLNNAISYNKEEIALSLINNGADVNAADTKGGTPLKCAIFSNEEEIALSLINNGANVNAADYEGGTPLQYAIQLKRDTIINALMDKEAKLSQQQLQSGEYIKTAIYHKKISLIKYLIKIGANVDAKDLEGNSLLQHAILVGEIEVVASLIENGVKVNVADSQLQTPLHYAITVKNYEIAKFLIINAANLAAENEKRQTPLDIIITTAKTNLTDPSNEFTKVKNIDYFKQKDGTKIYTPPLVMLQQSKSLEIVTAINNNLDFSYIFSLIKENLKFNSGTSAGLEDRATFVIMIREVIDKYMYTAKSNLENYDNKVSKHNMDLYYKFAFKIMDDINTFNLFTSKYKLFDTSINSNNSEALLPPYEKLYNEVMHLIKELSITSGKLNIVNHYEEHEHHRLDNLLDFNSAGGDENVIDLMGREDSLD